MGKKPSIVVTHPHIVEEWCSNKNALDPSTLTPGSHKKVWWECDKGHLWEATVKNRAGKGSGCPYCNNKQAWQGFNDLATLYPNLVEEWDPEKNKDTAAHFLPRSNKRAWWKCKHGHSWEAVIATRTRARATSCPVCAGQKLLVGYNDLGSQFPELIKEWHPSKNGQLEPSTINKGSDKKVWWECDNGHEWQAKVVNRTRLHQGCPYCSRRVVDTGVNDISTTNPDLVEEWDYNKNVDVDPSKLLSGSESKAWWVCEKGHSWHTEVRFRTRKGSGCPTCWSKTFVSKPEKELLDFVRGLNSTTVGTYRSLLSVSEVDIYVPSKSIAIEFNGLYWHSEQFKSTNYHQDKWAECKKQGIQLVQIWEDDWRINPEIVKSMLTHKLGCSETASIFARKTKVEVLGVGDVKPFLNAFHIQGTGSGSVKLGLKDMDNKLVATAIFKSRGDNEYELTRYATSCRVVGGLGKLISHFKKHYEVDSIITFADHCVSNGAIYETLGFTVDKVLSPDYHYIVGGERAHKFGYRLIRFENDPKLKWAEGLSEKELATLNNLLRIYDAGKTKYKLL